jgi:hypothetical protein
MKLEAIPTGSCAFEPILVQLCNDSFRRRPTVLSGSLLRIVASLRVLPLPRRDANRLCLYLGLISQSNPCGICGGQSCNEVFLRILQVFPALSFH